MKKKERLVIIISIIALILIAVGITYAYFTAQITGEESSTTVTVAGGSIDIFYDGGSNISISNVIPSDTALTSKTFTVTGTNTTALVVPYVVSLVVDSNTFSTGSLTYTLTSSNTSNNGSVVPSISTQTSIANGASTISLGSGYFLNGNNSIHTYVLNVYFPVTESDQNTEQGKSFSAHVNITASNARKASSYLSGITSTSGTVSPAFSPSTLDYDIRVPNSVTSVSLAASVQESGEVVRINGTITNAGQWSGSMSCSNVGSNPQTIDVTAIDGSVTHYTVDVIRSADSSLSTLTAKVSGKTLITLNQTFQPTILYYTNNTYTGSTFTVAATSNDPAATIKINGTAQALGSTSLVIPTASTGTYTVSIEVTASDGTTTTYQISITKVA